MRCSESVPLCSEDEELPILVIKLDIIYLQCTEPSPASWLASVAVLLVLLDGGGGMVVQSLRHQLQRQPVLEAAGLFDLGPLVLEPDLDLGLVEVELLGQGLPPLLRDVAVHLELGLQPLQLLGREGRARPLVLFAAFGLFQFPCPWTCSKSERTAGT